MAQIKCKCCGAGIEVSANQSTIEYDYCGSEQTVPKVDDEKKANLFNRANESHRMCDFNAAIRQYEAIVNEFPKDAEAHWGLCVSKYGIGATMGSSIFVENNYFRNISIYNGNLFYAQTCGHSTL